MSGDRLNLMLSTYVTLEGDGLHPNELIESLAQRLIYKKQKPDLFERNLQLAFVERSKELLGDEKVLPEIKSSVFKQSELLRKWFKKQERSSNYTVSGHYGFALKRLLAD